MEDPKEAARLYAQYIEKRKKLHVLVDSNNARATDLSNTEVQLEMIKEDKTKTDHALGELKNEEALLAIEYSELIENNETEVEQKFDESLANFSVTGTEDDASHYESRIVELTKKVKDLEAEVRTLHNDGLMCKQELDEINTITSEVAEKHAGYLNEIANAETELTRLQAEKQMLTSHQDELRQELIEAEMKQEPRAGAERGNAGIAHFDVYIKQVRMKLVEGREQKRQAELQHMDVSQRLDAKRRRREMAEKSRVTDATILLMQEVVNQLSFGSHLKVCIDAFYTNLRVWAERTIEEYNASKLTALSTVKAKILERVRKFRNLLEMIRDLICAVLSKVPIAYQAELQQFNDVKERFQQKFNPTC